MVAETHFDDWIVLRYARLWPELFDPAVLDPTVEFLAGLAGTGPVLEFGIGTGRVALPLVRRGLRVEGIELSPAMVAELKRQVGSDMDVIVGDFATARVPGSFGLVYLLRNTITNMTTQDEQIGAFRNAATHLRPGGFFVLEITYLPCSDSRRERPHGSLSPRPITLASRSTTSAPRSPSLATGGSSTASSSL